MFALTPSGRTKVFPLFLRPTVLLFRLLASVSRRSCRLLAGARRQDHSDRPTRSVFRAPPQICSLWSAFTMKGWVFSDFFFFFYSPSLFGSGGTKGAAATGMIHQVRCEWPGFCSRARPAELLPTSCIHGSLALSMCVCVCVGGSTGGIVRNLH